MSTSLQAAIPRRSAAAGQPIAELARWVRKVSGVDAPRLDSRRRSHDLRQLALKFLAAQLAADLLAAADRHPTEASDYLVSFRAME